MGLACTSAWSCPGGARLFVASKARAIAENNLQQVGAAVTGNLTQNPAEFTGLTS